MPHACRHTSSSPSEYWLHRSSSPLHQSYQAALVQLKEKRRPRGSHSPRHSEVRCEEGNDFTHRARTVHQPPHSRPVLFKRDMEVRREIGRKQPPQPTLSEARVDKHSQPVYPLGSNILAAKRNGVQQIYFFFSHCLPGISSPTTAGRELFLNVRFLQPIMVQFVLSLQP